LPQETAWLPEDAQHEGQHSKQADSVQETNLQLTTERTKEADTIKP